MADPLAPAGPAAAPLGGTPTPGSSPSPISSIPSFAPPVSSGLQGVEAQYEAQGHNWVWDKLGRWLTGGDLVDEQGSHGNAIADIPVVGDVLRAPGAITRGIADAGGFGLGKMIEGTAGVLGTLPSIGHLFDNAGMGTDLTSSVNPLAPKYDPAKGGADAAKALFDDLKAENGSGNFAKQFLIVGQWMKQNDPEAFASWEEALKKAQSGIGAQGAEVISTFLSEWGTAYADMTTSGVEGYLATAPELMYGGSGSFGQGLTRDLGFIFNLQRHAEKGAAALTGSRGGGIGPLPVGIHLMYEKDGVVQQDFGSRLNELRWALANDQEMTPIERHAAEMFEAGKWDAQHTYNFLVSKGQGYSSNAAAQLVLSFATDPLQVASMGAGLATSVGKGAAFYGKTAMSSNRLAQMYEAGAKSIGTTVQAVRADPILGPAAKVARTVIDPFSALPGPTGQASKDVLGATGVKATELGYGPSAVKDASKRASGWGLGDAFTRDFGVTAANFARKWVANEYVGNILRFTETSARRIIPEELVQQLAKNAPKDAVARMAEFVQRERKFYLRAGEQHQLAQRLTRLTGRSYDEMVEAVKSMTPDEQALWHGLSYSNAWAAFKTAMNNVPPDEWGHLAKRLDDMVILNPSEIDAVAANELLTSLKNAKKNKERIRLWNEAADRYRMIDDIGRVPEGGTEMIGRHIDYLERIIEQGGLHTSLSEKELAALPERFVKEFLDRWTIPADAALGGVAEPLWRIGFKPMAEQATGLIANAEGKLVHAFQPTIDNVYEVAGAAARRNQPITDMLGRTVGAAAAGSKPGRAALAMKDSLEVAINIAKDHVSGQRLITSMEQAFVRSVKADKEIGGVLSEKKLQTIFRVARDASQKDGFTLAGLSPSEFWRATESELAGVMEARVVKRELFSHLATAAGGDLRLLGLTSGMTQRIRAGLIARGLDPDNYMGAVTVKLYNNLRYTLNPTFFLQSIFDSPYFNIYRGVMPVWARAPKPGTALFEMERITNAIGHTGLARDLQMDFTERVAVIGWQREVVDRLGQLPGVKDGIGNRLKRGFGRMVLNNELAYLNSQIGNVVFDALDSVRATIDDKIANAATDAERAAWQGVKQDQITMLDSMRQDFVDRMGRIPTNEELGRDYLSQIIDDSRLEVRTADGLLNYKKVMSKGEYHKPTDVGQIRALDLEYGVEALALPNIHSVTDLRLAIAEKRVFIGDIKDIMKREGFHKDAIKRFTRAITFNWRHYFDDMARELKMTRYEMQGIEDMVRRAARNANMPATDYLTQVMEITTPTGIDDHLRYVLDTFRAVEKGGEASIEQLTKLVTAHLQPSMRNRLLRHFMTSLEGDEGLIQKAYDAAAAETDPVRKAAYVEKGQQLQRTLEKLKGGWGSEADKMYRELVVRRSGGDLTAGVVDGVLDPEVERGVRFFSQYLQTLDPKIVSGNVLNAIVQNIPTEGASAFDFTQALLMNTMAENFRLAEKDAIRLAHVQPDRSVLERSLNHPFFGLYPSSYFWGKVIPETFKFIALEPFGMKTTMGTMAYLKVQQSIALQSMYDDRMQGLWEQFGKSAIVNLLAYLSPAMPWEDMASNLPPWVRALSKDGLDFSKMVEAEVKTITPERWVNKFLRAGSEVGDIAGGMMPSDDTQAQPQMPFDAQPPTGTEEPAPQPSLGATKAGGLAPVLVNEMDELGKLFSGQ